MSSRSRTSRSRCSVILHGWDLSPIGFLILVNVLLLLLGCVLEGTTILLVIVPVLIPTAQALGIDMVHFGVVVVVNIMLGLITPPYGLLLFIMTSIAERAAAATSCATRCRSSGR